MSQLAILRCQWLVAIALDHGSWDASNPNTDIAASPTSQPLAYEGVRATQGHEGTQVQRIHTELFKQFP